MKKNLLVAALLGLGVIATAQADTLAKIKSSNTVTMGVRESSGALSYTVGDGKYAGYHVEICQRVLGDVQKQLSLSKLDIKYQAVTSQNRLPLVANGTVDIECGSTTNNATRQKDVAFAVTTYVEEVRIAVKANSKSNPFSSKSSFILGHFFLLFPLPEVGLIITNHFFERLDTKLIFYEVIVLV